MSQQDPQAVLRAIVLELLTYVLRYPDAKDSREGICTWWIKKSPAQGSEQDCYEAIAHLVAKGWFKEVTVSSKQKVYGLNPACMDEVRAAVQTLQQGL